MRQITLHYVEAKNNSIKVYMILVILNNATFWDIMQYSHLNIYWYSSKISVRFYQTTQNNVPKYGIIHCHHHAKLKFHML